MGSASVFLDDNKCFYRRVSTVSAAAWTIPSFDVSELEFNRDIVYAWERIASATGSANSFFASLKS